MSHTNWYVLGVSLLFIIALCALAYIVDVAMEHRHARKGVAVALVAIGLFLASLAAMLFRHSPAY